MAELESLADHLVSMSDAELLRVVSATTPSISVGASSSISVDGTPAFVKRIPLTALEVDYPYDTRNLFELPTFYSYGVGSAGFGAWRELAASQMVSEISGFPRHIHHRVMPRSLPPQPIPWGAEAYVHYWGSSRAVGRFMEARDAATEELWLILEHGGSQAVIWLVDNSENLDDVLEQTFAAIGELQTLGAVHFDAHLANVVTDGSRSRIVDFGLTMAEQFDLSASERQFLSDHRHYDYGAVLASLGMALALTLGEEPSIEILRSHIDDLSTLKGRCPGSILGAIDRYRHPIMYTLEFLERLQQPDKFSIYDDQHFAHLLHDCDIATG